MAQTLSFSPLALDLPSTRMSVDFTTFASSYSGALATVDQKAQPTLPTSHLIPRRPLPRHLPLSAVREEIEPGNMPNFSHKSRRWQMAQQQIPVTARSEYPLTILSRTNSSASTASSGSAASTAASSAFSNTQSPSTARTSFSSVQYTKPMNRKANLSTLPVSLLEQIFAYALCLPLTVSIGPQNPGNRHMQYRYHRAGLDYLDIQLILKHPIFLVSHHIRNVALGVFYEQCDFVIDLHRVYHTKVSSTLNDNLKSYERFWIYDAPPKMVTDTLCNLSRLHLRLPVPSCDNVGHRGREEDNWMDGSDGKGGGNWKIKSMKKEQEDAIRIQKCLDAVLKLLIIDPPDGQRVRGRGGSLRRSLSRTRSKSRNRASERGVNTDEKKRMLRRLEVVLVKKSSHVMVLPETLGLVKLLRSIHVTGLTKYTFELQEQQVLWATKYRRKWKGFEPDGRRLLTGMRTLGPQSCMRKLTRNRSTRSHGC